MLIILTVLFQLPVQKRQEQIFIDGIIRLLDILLINEGSQLANAIFENRDRAISLRLEKMLQLQGVENVILYNNQGAMINFALGSDKDGSEIKTARDYTNGDIFTEELIYQNEASLHYEHVIKFGDDILGFIEKSSKRATEVVSKLMDFSRKEIKSKFVVDLNGIVSDVLEICKTTIDNR